MSRLKGEDKETMSEGREGAEKKEEPKNVDAESK